MKREPPDWLTKDARPFWDAIVETLEVSKEFRGESAAAQAAQLFLQFVRVTDSLNKNGQISEIRDDKGVLRKQEPAPEFRAQMQLVPLIRKLLTELDTATDGETKTGDPFADVLRVLDRTARSRKPSAN